MFEKSERGKLQFSFSGVKKRNSLLTLGTSIVLLILFCSTASIKSSAIRLQVTHI